MSKQQAAQPVPVIKMEQTTSTNLRAYGYDFARQILRVKFLESPPGVVYEVDDFTKEDFDRFLNSGSRGSFYQTVIRTHPERYPVRKVVCEGWDGEEHRVCLEPLEVVSRDVVPFGTSIRLANGEQVKLEGMELTLEQEQVLAARIADCVNACTGVPSERLQEVINLGLSIAGRMERRRREEEDEANIPDEPSLEEELAVAAAARHGVELSTSASARLDAEGWDIPFDGKDDRREEDRD